MISHCSVVQFPRKDLTRAGHFTAVLSPETRAVISLSGATIQGQRQLPVTNSKDSREQQAMKQPRKESVEYVFRKVGNTGIFMHPFHDTFGFINKVNKLLKKKLRAYM